MLRLSIMNIGRLFEFKFVYFRVLRMFLVVAASTLIVFPRKTSIAASSIEYVLPFDNIYIITNSLFRVLPSSTCSLFKVNTLSAERVLAKGVERKGLQQSAYIQQTEMCCLQVSTSSKSFEQQFQQYPVKEKTKQNLSAQYCAQSRNL